MVTKARLKLIKSLSRKKNRIEQSLFVVEGYKSILDLINSGMYPVEIYVLEDHNQLEDYDTEIITSKDLKSISNLSTPPGYLAVFEIRAYEDLPQSGSVIALEDVKDPGNLGTIIRLADWFGMKHIVCSIQTVDVYNPKTIQSSMGSIARVHVHYTDLEAYLKNTSSAIYPTAMHGESMYDTAFQENGILLMGSESHGLSDSLLNLATPVSIPQNYNQGATESLNVAMATALFLGEWKRPTGK